MGVWGACLISILKGVFRCWIDWFELGVGSTKLPVAAIAENLPFEYCCFAKFEESSNFSIIIALSVCVWLSMVKISWDSKKLMMSWIVKVLPDFV